MSETALRTAPQDYAPPAIIARLRTPALTVGLLDLIVVLGLAATQHRWDLFLRSWLMAFLFWLGPTTGSLVLLMLQYVSGGNWGRLGRRFWEAAAGNLPLMFAAWLPIAFGMKLLYSWAAMSHAEAAAKLGQSKVDLYLNPTLF